MAWWYVIFAGCFEVLFTTCLRYVDGFRHVGWTLAFVAAMCASLFLVGLAIKTLPMGTVYAVWTGLGAFGTVVVGMMFYGEPVTIPRMVLLCVLVASVAVLKLVSSH